MPDLSELADVARERKGPLPTIAALISIAVVLIAALFWLFNVNAKADGAVESSKANAVNIEKKADKDDMKDGFRTLNEKFDKLQEFLLRDRKR